MKKRLSLLTLIVALFTSLSAQIALSDIVLAGNTHITNTEDPTYANAAEGSMIYGYCDANYFDVLLQKYEGVTKQAIYIPASRLTQIVGSSFSAIRVYFPNVTGTNASVFISNSLEEEPIHTQTVEFTKSQWNEVALTTPLVIEAEKDYYIGYEIKVAASAGVVALDKGPGHVNGAFIALPGENSEVPAEWLTLQEVGYSYNLLIQVVITGEKLIENEIRVQNFLMPTYNNSSDFTVRGSLFNGGNSTLTSFDIEYTIGDAEPVIKKIENINVASNKSYSFSLSNLTTELTGLRNVLIKVKSPNGVETFEDPDNVYELNKMFYVPQAEAKQRKVLLENFTTAQCSNCPAMHTAIKNALVTRPNIIWVAHHAGFYTDTYTIKASEDYLWFFNAGGATYAPAAMLDRTNLMYEGASTSANTPVFGNKNLTALFDAQLAIPAFVEVGIEKAYNEETRELTVTVSSNSIESLPLENLTINVYVTEDGLKSSQAGASGTYIHDHVIRKVLTPTWGDTFTYDAEGKVTRTYTTTFESRWKPENMNVVAFVSNYDSEVPNNCLVLNSEIKKIIEGNTSLPQNTNNDIVITVNNSVVTVSGEFTYGEVYDVTGKLIKQFDNNQSSFTLNSGIYIVKTGNNTQKVIIR